MDTLLWEDQLVQMDVETPMSAYHNLERVMLNESNQVDPYQELRAKGFKNLARYTEMVVIPPNGHKEERNYSQDVVSLLNKATNLYNELNEAGLSSNGYDLNGRMAPVEVKSEFNKQRMDLAVDLMNFAMQVWSKYKGIDDLAAADDWHNDQYSSFELSGGPWSGLPTNQDVGMKSMMNAILDLSEQTQFAYDSPEFKLALAAYMAAKGLNSKLNGAFTGVNANMAEKFQYFFTVAMKDSEYMQTMNDLASNMVLSGGSYSPVHFGEYNPGQNLKMNNW